MAYREPGVFTEIINARPLTGSAPNMIPMIIGDGPKFFDFTDKPIVRSTTGDSDILPATKVTAINRVYTVSGGVETTIAANTNYTLGETNTIVWETTAPNKPAAGSTYYVDFEARPEASQYLPTYVTSFETLNTAYGGMLMKTATGGAATTVNPVYMGAYLALESGASGVYVIQVEPADKDNYSVVIATDIVTALDRAVGITDAYFIVPMTGDSTAVGAVITHCDSMSTVLERKERVCFVSKNVSTPAATTGIFTSNEIDAAVNLVKDIKNKRVRVPFVTKATKVLSDGAEHELTAEYVCAALAGLSSIIPVARALTRQKLYNFVSLKNVTGLKRADKNKLAEVGYMVLDQNGGPGSPVVIRHGVTTKMDNVADKEHSVVTSLDYTAKYVRVTLDGYIGLYNIDDFLITKVTGSICT
jgi:hypothetical protein